MFPNSNSSDDNEAIDSITDSFSREGRADQEGQASREGQTGELKNRFSELVHAEEKKLRDENVTPERFEKVIEFLPDYIKSLVERNDPEKTQEILNTLAPYCLDTGLDTQRELYITVNGDLRHETISNVEMLNRTALVSYVTEHYPDSQSAAGKLYFQTYDIKDFRAADQVESPNGDRGADFLINKIAQRLQEKTEAINNVLIKHMGKSSAVVPCRYGGDELVVLFENVSDPEIRRLISDEITGEKDGLRSLRGYYLRNGEVVLERVELKDGFKEFGVPENTRKAGVFWEHLNKGLLLDEKEVDEIIMVRAKLGDSSPEELSKKQQAGDWKERLEEIVRKHPDFGSLKSKIEGLAEDDAALREELLSGFERFVRENLYDRLLGEAVAGMKDFVEHYMKKPFTQIHVVDVKGIKEINDFLSVAQGDSAIVEAWKRVKNIVAGDDGALPFEERTDSTPNVRFFRRGSTLLVCETAKDSLGEGKRERLLGISDVVFEHSGIESNFTVATGVIKLQSNYTPSHRLEVRKILDEVFARTDLDWYKKQIVTNLEHPEYFYDPEVPVKEMSIATVNPGDLGRPEFFYKMFLYGKRKEERLGLAIEAINSVMTDDLKDEDKTQKILTKTGMERKEVIQALRGLRGVFEDELLGNNKDQAAV
jgi:GGDEF domain-containing protein